MKIKYLFSITLLTVSTLSLPKAHPLTPKSAGKYATQLTNYEKQLSNIEELLNKNKINNNAVKKLQKKEAALMPYANRRVYQPQFKKDAAIIEVWEQEDEPIEYINLGIVPILIGYVVNNSYPEGTNKNYVMGRIRSQKDAIKLKLNELRAAYNL